MSFRSGPKIVFPGDDKTHCFSGAGGFFKIGSGFLKNSMLDYPMQRFPKVFAALVLTLFVLLPLRAAEAEIQGEGTPQRKLQRGFLNVALSPIEISNELSKEIRNDTLPPSWFIGLGRGAAYTVGRALVGVYEMVTFPLPYPAHYKPVLHPEFPWEHAPENKT